MQLNGINSKQDIIIMKIICKKCGVEKPLLDYGKYTAGKGGIRNVCKECERIRRKNRKRKNADRINEGRRERTAIDPEYRERTLKSKRKYRTIHRDRWLKLEREGAKRRYRNPETREKLIKHLRNTVKTDPMNKYKKIKNECINIGLIIKKEE